MNTTTTSKPSDSAANTALHHAQKIEELRGKLKHHRQEQRRLKKAAQHSGYYANQLLKVDILVMELEADMDGHRAGLQEAKELSASYRAARM